MKYRKILIFNIFLCIVTILAYYAVTVNPQRFWASELMGLTIPALIVLHIPFVAFWLFRNKALSLLSLFTLFFGYRFIVATLAIFFYKTDENSRLKVLSYNVRTFNGFVSKRVLSESESDAMLQWVCRWPGDVICFQEFYSYPKSKVFNTVQRLHKSGFKYHYFSIMRTFKWGSSVGMAIFSKYPIVNKGIVYKKEGSNNQIIWADISFQGKIVRLYNAHFQSIFLKEEEFPGYESGEEAQRDLISIIYKLRKAYLKRSIQVNMLLDDLKSCPHPYVICTDLNDTPYSNAYLRLRDVANNSFESAGFGLGYTYNGFLPTLRIDHQFYSHQLSAAKHTVHDNIGYSDHFPLEVAYLFDLTN